MSINGFGELIESVRLRNGVTQEQLSRGISSNPTVSRIENGERVPDALLAKAFLERLGIATDCVDVYLGDEDYDRFLLRERIEACIDEWDFVRASELIQDYLNGCDASERLHIQFAEHCKLRVRWAELGLRAMMQRYDTVELPDFVSRLDDIILLYKGVSQVLALTYSGDGRIDKTLLSFEEIKLLLEKSFLELIIFKSDRTVCQKSISVITHLLKRIDGMYCDSEELVPAAIGSIVALVKYYWREGEPQRALRLCETAISRLQRTSYVRSKTCLTIVKATIAARSEGVDIISAEYGEKVDAAGFCMMFYDRLNRLRKEDRHGGQSK